MDCPRRVMRAPAATASPTGRERILRNAYATGNRAFFIGTRLADHACLTFGVKADMRPTKPGRTAVGLGSRA